MATGVSLICASAAQARVASEIRPVPETERDKELSAGSFVTLGSRRGPYVG